MNEFKVQVDAVFRFAPSMILDSDYLILFARKVRTGFGADFAAARGAFEHADL